MDGGTPLSGRWNTGRQVALTLVVWGFMLASLFYILYYGGKLASALFMIAFVINVYLLLGRWSGIARVKGERQFSPGKNGEPLSNGSRVHIAVELEIPGIWPVPFVTAQECLLSASGKVCRFETAVVPDMRRKGTFHWDTPPLGRGVYRFERTVCVTEDIFGLFQHKGMLHLPGSFSVLPRTTAIMEWKALERQAKGNRGAAGPLAASRSDREALQGNGIREYVYGDRLSRIHWGATARTGAFKSKEFEKEALPQAIVLLDRQKEAYSLPEQFELGVSIAASLLQFGQRRRQLMDLLSLGERSGSWEPGKSGGGLNRTMLHLAQAEADSCQSLLQTVEQGARLFEQGLCAIIISPQSGEPMLQTIAWLKRRQLPVCHIWLPAPGPKEERGGWCSRLRAAGHLAYAVDSLEELPAVLGDAPYG
ncbi:MAG: hypothetical protein K0R57_1738 [Paenibacillaceae bacterium]|nr:hypothetical protein [Paenibacillaceae bacterium]